MQVRVLFWAQQKKRPFKGLFFCCISLGIKGFLLSPHRLLLAVRATLPASSQVTRCQGYHITSPQATRKRLVQQIPSLMPTTPPNSPNLHLQPQVKNVPIPQSPSTEHTKRFLPKQTRLTSWGKRLPVRENIHFNLLTIYQGAILAP